MANEKLYKASMERSQYIKEADAGFLSFRKTVEALRGTFNKEYPINKYLSQVIADQGLRNRETYIKIIDFNGNSGEAKLVVLIGSNSSEAQERYEGFIGVINFATEDFLIERTLNGQKYGYREAITRREYGNTSKKGKSNTRKSNSSRKSKRTVNKKATSYINPDPPPDQIELRMDSEGSVAPPPVFNTEQNSVPPKDFASIFLDSNLNLYNENPSNNIEIESPPGVAKYLELGIDIDRPSVICSTELNSVSYSKDDDAKNLYSQLALNRLLRVETIFNNLKNVNTEDVEGLVEEQDDLIDSTKQAIESLDILANLDTDLLDSIVKNPKTIAAELGFESNDLMTKLYAQVLYDLGAASEFGVFQKWGTIGRNLGSTSKSQISLQTQHNPPYFKPSIYSRSIKNGNMYKSITDPDSYQLGDYGNYLGYNNIVEPSQLLDSATNLGLQFKYDASEDKAVHLMQSIYTELLLSKLVSSGDTTIEELKSRNLTNISELLFGSFADTNQDLNSVKVTSGLASILKYNSAGENYYPFEESIPNGEGINGRTFFESMIQPGIGALIEDTDPQFDILNKWTESSRSHLNGLFRYTDSINLDGGSAIVLNEIVLGIVDWLTQPQRTIGNLKHPKSPQFSRQIEDFTSSELRALLVSAAPHFARGTMTDFCHTYNTFGYAYFPGQQDFLIDILKNDDCGFGIYHTHVNDICLGPGLKSQGPAYGWDPSLSRPINGTLPAILARNNIYEELSRLFGIIENGIMTSIEIMLSKSGLLKQTIDPDYDTICDGFFTPGVPTSKGSDPNGRQGIGSYKKTTFSGVPLFTIRHMIAQCLWEVIDTGVADSIENILKASKCAVENLDDSKGPVRWKVTHGVWPQFNPDLPDLKESVYNALVPSEVISAFENGPPEVEINFDSDGNPQAVMSEDPTAGWEFINSVEGFCPLTLVLDGEDNGQDSVSFIRGNRSLLDNVYDNIVSYRAKIYKMKRFLNSPIEAFEKFPDNLEKSVGKIALGPIKELSTFDQINPHEIIKFANSMQIANSRKSLRLESPSPRLNYLPNKYIVTIENFLTARAFITDYMKQYNRPDLSVIHTIGIPSGYLESIASTTGYFSIARSAEYMFFPDHVWSDHIELFHPEIYLIPGSLNNCNSQMDVNSIIYNCRYFVSNRKRAELMNYSQVVDYLGDNTNSTFEILKNHVLDYCLQIVLKITTGMDLNEDTFRFNEDTNKRLIPAKALDSVAQLVQPIPTGILGNVPGDKPINVFDIFKKSSDLTANEINTFLGSLDCRLFSSIAIPVKCLNPRLFDRVFSMIIHPSDHSTETSGPGLYQQEEVFKILLDDDSVNNVQNDHFASYYYRVQV